MADDIRFPEFLRWLVDREDYNVKDIINVVEEPWKWQKEFDQFIDVAEHEVGHGDERAPSGRIV